ncbi:hypothetical protein Krac_7628 [Ktedonobacter racemifer DSM 44963]|uniref:Uncharacterized protein n=1 Tax=Ktedonobacter racemifer DSM 44963 TaxID=485913 RepID=D6TKN5_KTERA|nr:hypothetical protein Krac_7628 [Ktedonobacter racemifer DSM 44963]
MYKTLSHQQKFPVSSLLCERSPQCSHGESSFAQREPNLPRIILRRFSYQWMSKWMSKASIRGLVKIS